MNDRCTLSASRIYEAVSIKLPLRPLSGKIEELIEDVWEGRTIVVRRRLASLIKSRSLQRDPARADHRPQKEDHDHHLGDDRHHYC